MGVAETIEIPPLSNELSAMKDEGNEYFRSGEYLKAAGSYTKAIKVRPRLCQKRPPRFVEDPSLTPSPRPHRISRTPARMRLNESNWRPCSRTAARVS